MEKLTLGIIKAMKHNYEESLKETLIKFMMNYSGCDREVYTPDKVNQIIFQAFADFMDTVDSPREQLYMMKDAMSIHHLDKDYDIYDAMLSTMMLVQVRDNDCFINGFDASFKSD